MIVDIEKVIVKDRIRKDFGNIEELAEDIKENGLINPPVVNKDYCLLAGERRLRACKSLGWKQIEVRMMDTRDAEHELNVEISENENRKEFSKAERVDYMKRLLAIEQVKAKERIADSGGNISTPKGKARDITAEQFGISGKTMEKEISIADHKDALTPKDFADWDEGRLSTNKAYQKIKTALAAERERVAELEAEKNKPSTKDKFYQSRIKSLSDTNDDLKSQIVELERKEYELKQQLEDQPELPSLLDEALRELRAFKAKYYDLEELSAIFTAIDKTFEGVV